MTSSHLPPALVLAAGLGTRLRPLTALRAKPAMPIAGVPLIVRILRWLRAAGASEVVVNLHHRPESITRIVGDGSPFGLAIRYSWEQPLLGSGGGPRRAFSLVEDDELLVVNGDTLTGVDPAALVAAHRSSGALVTLAVIENPHPERYGGVRIDDDVVTGFSRRGEDARGWHFVGVQAVSRAAYADVPDGVPAESVAGVYRELIRAGRGAVRAWRTASSFYDVGTPATYLETASALAGSEPARLVDPDAQVAPEARVDRSIVWDGVRIEPGAELSECIVATGSVVPAGARYHRSVLMPAPGGADAGGRGLLVVPFAQDAGEERMPR